MTDLPALLSRLGGHGRPRLTWYCEDERVELSRHVLDNWVTKTTHLLVDELDVTPGRRVVVDLPVHWRAIVWSLAALRAGAVLEPAPDAVVVTDDPERWPRTADLVVVALPALARTAGSVPPGAVDANAAVMTYPDRPGAWPPVPSDAPAFGAVRHGDLVDWGGGSAPPPPRAAGRCA
ncbi:TIGR03089 family protein, partial [Actinotalea sp. M2MS4P-6]|uniref:TIGR03089 family protein n=1 Tax=Actinotalea sp. M2MS4P-6 TaxID=2983762 RepID=UPI0021E47438